MPKWVHLLLRASILALSVQCETEVDEASGCGDMSQCGTPDGAAPNDSGAELEEGAEVQTSSELQASLAIAEPGAVVTVADGAELIGNFTIPAGVTLRSAEGASIWPSDPSMPTVSLQTEETSSSSALSGLSIYASGAEAVVVSGGGGAELSGVTIEHAGSFGVLVSGVATISLEDVSIQGTSDLIENIESAGFSLQDVGSAIVTDTIVIEVGPYGGLVADSAITMRNVEVTAAWNALAATRSIVDLDRVTMQTTQSRVGSELTAVGVFNYSDVTVASTALQGGGVGWFHHFGSLAGQGLTASGIEQVGVWGTVLQSIDLQTVRIEQVEAFGFFAQAAPESIDAEVRLVDLSVSSVPGSDDAYQDNAGDGVALVDWGHVTLDEVNITSTGRVGLLLTARPDAVPDWMISDTTVSPNKGTNGALAQQSGTVLPVGQPGGWDEGISRSAETLALDIDRAQSGKPIFSFPDLPDLVEIPVDN